MSIILVHTAKNGRKSVEIFSQMRWAVLDDGVENSSKQSLKNRIRSTGQMVQASHYVLTKLERATFIGLFSDPVIYNGSRSASRFSLAALLLSAINKDEHSQSLLNAVFILGLPSNQDKRVVVVIEGGQIAMDAVMERNGAIEVVNERYKSIPGLNIYSEHAEVSHPHDPIGWDQIVDMAAGASDAKLTPVPTSPWMLRIALLAVVLAGSYLAYDNLVIKPRVSQLRAQQLALLDKTGDYLQKADMELGAAVWDPTDIEAALNTVRGIPAFVRGWVVTEVECSSKVCSVTLSRVGGLATDIQTAMPDWKVNSAASGLDRQVMTFERPEKRAGISRSSILSPEESMLRIRPLLQTMANAGISTSIGEPKVLRFGVLEGVTSPNLLKQVPVIVSVPMHQAVEVIKLLKDQVQFESFKVLVGESKKIQTSLTGVIYVK
jgi:hypothetical protein